jgi:hypothetical protein
MQNNCYYCSINKLTCRKDNCDKNIYRHFSYTYSSNCSDHLCSNHLCLRCNINERTVDSEYCITHKCVIVNCTEQINRINMCKTHICIFILCANQKKLGMESCGNHKCRKKDCNQDCEINSKIKYCKKHICRFFLTHTHKTSCPKILKDEEKQCLTHTCEIDDCIRNKKAEVGQKVLKYYKYCKKHNCVINYCEKSCGEEDYLCDDHKTKYDNSSDGEYNKN